MGHFVREQAGSFENIEDFGAAHAPIFQGPLETFVETIGEGFPQTLAARTRFVPFGLKEKERQEYESEAQRENNSHREGSLFRTCLLPIAGGGPMAFTLTKQKRS